MQLGIEAIIILVIAMVLLGLGIAFISGFFKIGTAKLTEPFNAIQFGCDPNANDPIKVIPSEISFPEGSAAQQIKVCFYQDSTLSAASKVDLNMIAANCKSTTAGATAPTLVSVSQAVPKGQIGGYNVLLQPVANTKAGVYICTLEAHDTATPALPALASKQITITVT